jgi:hypothetical protein
VGYFRAAAAPDRIRNAGAEGDSQGPGILHKVREAVGEDAGKFIFTCITRDAPIAAGTMNKRLRYLGINTMIAAGRFSS